MRRMVNRAALLTLIVVAALVALVQLDPVPVRPQKAVADQPARHASVEIPEATKQQVVVAYGKLPLSFETNQGQTDSRVKFLSRGSGYTLFLTSTEAVLALRPPRAKPSAADHGAATRPEPPAQRDVLRIRLVGANPAPQMTGLDALPGKSNYFIGKDPQKWMRNVPHYTKVNYEEVYPDIDLVFYGNQRRLEYDFVVAPSADPGAITLGFEGADRLEIDPQGDLVVHMAGGEVRFQKPVVYQELDGARQIVPGHYALNGDDRVGFQIAAYDAGKALIIDPVLAYSTYLGGSKTDQGIGLDEGFGIAVDADGNAYVTGFTLATDFPTTVGAFDTSLDRTDAFVTKLNPDGSLAYSTYLGGSNPEEGIGIAVDALGNAYVTGKSAAPDFPTTPGAFQTMGSGCFVTKLDPAGSTLVYSTFINTANCRGIAVDATGNAYVTGSAGSTFPTTMGAFDRSLVYTDAFVAKLNPDDSNPNNPCTISSITYNDCDDLIYSTFLGGSDGDVGFAIAVDGAGNAYVTGQTSSSDFPTTVGAFDTSVGYIDAFVAKLDTTGDTCGTGLNSLCYSTFLGGSGLDEGFGIAVDAFGNAYVTGKTAAPDFPTMGAFQATFGGYVDAFVTKLNPDGSLAYSTFLGGGGLDEGFAIAVDADGNAYVTGMTAASDFPTVGAFDTSVGYVDAFVTKLNPDGSLAYSTFLGGSKTDRGFGIAVDADGNAYVTGMTAARDFPTVGAFDTSLGYIVDGFVSKIVEREATLTISKAGKGEGTVTSSDGGIACPTDCTENYSGGTEVILTATPDAGFTFGGLSGDSDCSDGQFTMIADRSCTATFNTLSVSPTSLDFGPVTVGSSSDLSFTVTNGGSEKLTVSAVTSSPFSIVSKTPFGLEFKQSETVTVRLTAPSLGTFLGNVVFTSAGGNAFPVVQGEGTLTPHIEGLSPTSGSVGTSVTIVGFQFGARKGTSNVKFGSEKAKKMLSWSDTQIQARVPSLDPGTHDVTVTTNNGTSNAVPFTVDGPPSQSSTGSISGTVTDASTGRKLDGVDLTTDTGELASTNRRGKYTLTDVPKGDRTVTASKNGYATKPKMATVFAGESTRVDFALVPE